MILQPLGDRPTVYTNVHATLTSLIKKYFLNNSVRQNKVQILFDSEILHSSIQRIFQTAISSETVPTPPVDSLQSLRHDRLFMNIWSPCLHTNSSMEYDVISSDIQLSKYYAAICICNQKMRGVVFSKHGSHQLNIS